MVVALLLGLALIRQSLVLLGWLRVFPLTLTLILLQLVTWLILVLVLVLGMPLLISPLLVFPIGVPSMGVDAREVGGMCRGEHILESGVDSSGDDGNSTLFSKAIDPSLAVVWCWGQMGHNVGMLSECRDAQTNCSNKAIQSTLCCVEH
ncbi:hypothetical protein P691DRAFT_787529 [Macrolepiota fuliginosa MF-IS2]|uniref:Uncharacterized protein n=1 Tax=Macrolepiota fuliginosa MF-IS2 TaxID=1400762 RepID=A0A9P6BZQ5_9AGAR|nr:hypothetical protein P691DRAFT_787529 [Macrolepiota fuliginosa MF-IS2]